MEERQDGEHTLLARHAVRKPAQALQRVGDEIEMRERSPFGKTGRAARILQHGDIAPRVDRQRHEGAVIRDEIAELDMRLVMRRMSHVAAPEELIKQALGLRQDRRHRAEHDLAHAAAAQQGGDLGIDLLHVERHHDLGAGIGGELADLLLDIEWVKIDDGAAGFEHGEIGDDVVRGIGQDEAHPHALLDAERGEALGGAAHQRTDFTIAIALAEKIEAGTIGKAPGAVFEELVERLLGEFRVPVDAGRIGRQPGPTRLLLIHGTHRKPSGCLTLPPSG